MSKKVIFELSAFEDLKIWAEIDRNMHRKIILLLKYIVLSSANIATKAEPLERELSGYWCIKLDELHCLVYKMTKREVFVASCRYH